MLNLIFFRHAESTGNAISRMSGLADDPLTDRGRDQARRLGNRLLAEGAWPTRIYTSPLQRARQTLAIVTDRFLASPADPVLSAPSAPNPGKPSRDQTSPDQTSRDRDPRQPSLPTPIVDPDLQEFDNGILRGLTWPEAQARHSDLCRALESTRSWLPIPGAETLVEGRSRADRFIQRLAIKAKPDDRVWVISHAWFLEQAISSLLGCDKTWQITPKNTGIFEFSLDLDFWRQIDQKTEEISRLSTKNTFDSQEKESQEDQNRFNQVLWQVRRFNDIKHL